MGEFQPVAPTRGEPGCESQAAKIHASSTRSRSRVRMTFGAGRPHGAFQFGQVDPPLDAGPMLPSYGCYSRGVPRLAPLSVWHDGTLPPAPHTLRVLPRVRPAIWHSGSPLPLGPTPKRRRARSARRGTYHSSLEADQSQQPYRADETKSLKQGRTLVALRATAVATRAVSKISDMISQIGFPMAKHSLFVDLRYHYS